MWFKRLFKRNSKPENDGPSEATVDQGIYYLYLILFMQIAFVLGLVAVIMFVGKVVSTPWWVFLLAIGLGISGCVYVYRKARKKFHKFKQTMRDVHLSDRNYEISFMGGVLTMRVEQAPQRPLLEAPSNSILDAEPVRPDEVP